jgi:hypothetical protein
MINITNNINKIDVEVIDGRPVVNVLVDQFSAAKAEEAAREAKEDAEKTALDRIATGEDRVATGEDRVATGLDAIATAADRVQTGLDRIATGEDRVQTGLDRGQTGLDRIAAANSAASAASAALNTPLTGFSVGENTAIAATDTTLQAFGKAQGQISERIGGTVGVGQVAFGTGTKVIGGDSGLVWDNVNKRLGIGTNAPTRSIDIFQASATVSVTSTANTQTLGFITNAIDNNVRGGFTTNLTTGEVRIGALGGAGFFPTLYANGVEGFRMFSTTRNVLIQSGGTFTDAGFRLDVNGTARVQGATTITGRTKIGNNVFNDPSTYLIVGISGTAARGAMANDSLYQDFMFVNTSVSIGNINNWSFGQRRDTFFGNALGSFQIVGGYINNSGLGSTVGGGYRAPLICNPNGDVLINGGNANVVNGLIGLKVNAPTAHVDITASTTANASLRIRSGTDPTSPNDGDIWFDGTDIKIRIGGVTKTFVLT